MVSEWAQKPATTTTTSTETDAVPPALSRPTGCVLEAVLRTETLALSVCQASIRTGLLQLV